MYHILIKLIIVKNKEVYFLQSFFQQHPKQPYYSVFITPYITTGLVKKQFIFPFD